VTGCNNQIIDVEFFAADGQFVTMEINPRILCNSIPLYEKVAGINPWILMEGLKKGVVSKLSSAPQSGVVRYNYVYRDEPVEIEHDADTFSIICETLSHTYHTSAENKPHKDLIKDLDEQYSPDILLSLEQKRCVEQFGG
jgi:hypothetical protein